ncbi:insulin-like growth factor II isoform X1 [Pleurodeles waltl]|uniref:insulin-like growth factor II isoform X1 n=1 Tax=Pleurodeles waltl TaxID=8319 RepID=UPI0037094B58
MHATGPELYREVSCSRPKHTAQSCRQPGVTALKVPKMTVTCQLLLLLFSFMVHALDCVMAQGPVTETLCGGELVDTLLFVCGERGFYFSQPSMRQHRRFRRGIVEECCYRSCDLALLETYCSKPAKNQRDISSTSFTALPPLSKDIFRKPSHVKYSKYDVWQRKTTQRLRRGVPAILRARHYRWQAEALENSKEVRLSHPLTATRSQHTLLVRALSETSDRRK